MLFEIFSHRKNWAENNQQIPTANMLFLFNNKMIKTILGSMQP